MTQSKQSRGFVGSNPFCTAASKHVIRIIFFCGLPAPGIQTNPKWRLIWKLIFTDPCDLVIWASALSFKYFNCFVVHYRAPITRQRRLAYWCSHWAQRLHNDFTWYLGTWYEFFINFLEKRRKKKDYQTWGRVRGNASFSNWIWVKGGGFNLWSVFYINAHQSTEVTANAANFGAVERFAFRIAFSGLLVRYL